MVEGENDIPDFRDRDAVEAWLRDKPQDWSVVIATRAALRIAPLLVQFEGKQRLSAGSLVIVSLRCTLTTSGAGTWPPEVVRDAAALSADAAAALPAARAAADAAADAALLVDRTTPSKLVERPLWHESTDGPFQDEWNTLSQRLLHTDPNWRFWIDWYESHLTGGPKNWDPLQRIALIPDEDWTHEDSPAHVNAIIAALVRLDGQDARWAARSAVSDAQDEIARHGIGGNYPPEPLGDAPTRDEFEALQASLERLRAELGKNEAPDKEIIEVEAKVVRSFWMRTRDWCAKHADTMAGEFSKESGKQLAQLLFKLGPALGTAYAALQMYLQTL